MLDDAKLLMKTQRARQAALEVGVLLALVQIAPEDGIPRGDAMVEPGLEVVRLGEVGRSADAPAEAVIGRSGPRFRKVVPRQESARAIVVVDGAVHSVPTPLGGDIERADSLELGRVVPEIDLDFLKGFHEVQGG